MENMKQLKLPLSDKEIEKIKVERVIERLIGRKTIPQLQEILNNTGYQHFIVISKDTLMTRVDGKNEMFDRHDVVTGIFGSGMTQFGMVCGDHRMIQHIADDVQAAFELLND